MRRRLIVVLAVLAVLVAAHTAVWLWVEGLLESGLAQWQAMRQAEGWTIIHDAPVRAGWPLEARLDIPRMSLSGPPGQPGSFVWTANQVALRIQPTKPSTLLISFTGPQQIHLSGAPDIGFIAERMDASTPLKPATLLEAGMDVDVGNLRATLPSGDLTVTRLQLHGDAAQNFSLSAGDVALPPPPNGGAWALGTHIASVVIAGQIVGNPPPAPGLYARAAAWRDRGGKLDLPHLSIGWGPLGVTGSGTLALDSHMQPDGTATLRIVGYNQTLDALAAGGNLTPRAASAAKAVLGLIAHTPDGGGAPLVDAPLTLRDGEVTFGQIPLTRLPPVVWPDAR